MLTRFSKSSIRISDETDTFPISGTTIMLSHVHTFMISRIQNSKPIFQELIKSEMNLKVKVLDMNREGQLVEVCHLNYYLFVAK